MHLDTLFGNRRKNNRNYPIRRYEKWTTIDGNKITRLWNINTVGVLDEVNTIRSTYLSMQERLRRRWWLLA